MRRGWRSVDEQREYLAPRLLRWYPTFTTGGQKFENLLVNHAGHELVVLDAGAGDSGYIRVLKGRVKKIIGVDQNQALLDANTVVDEKIVADLGTIPLPNTSIDLISAEFVLEHLEHPQEVFQEWQRILKPGGRIIALTSNLANPVMLLSHFTPVAFHHWLKKKLLKKPEHVHPTWYRANSSRSIARLAADAGLTVSQLDYAGNPEYIAVHATLAVPAILVERFINRPGFHWLQMYLVIVLTKK